MIKFHLIIAFFLINSNILINGDLNIETNLPIQTTDDNKIVCRNEITGEPVDWFTLYKLPKKVDRSFDSRKKANNSFISQGTAYTYMTNLDPEWKLSNLSINDTQSFPGQTLNLLYKVNFTNSTIGYVLYNDQADKVTVIKGHTKGVILFNENSAVWIVHSIPHYPPKPSENSYFIRPSQCLFGQSMLCMSFKFDELEKIGKQMLFNYPQVYDFFIPEHLKSSKSQILGNLLSAINGDHVKEAPWSNLNTLSTLNGEKMLSFAKFTDFEDDLYSGLVAPNLKSNLLTETWNNGAGTLRSNCSLEVNFHVMNIESIRMDVANLRFSVHNDHSKWTVTDYDETFLELVDLDNQDLKKTDPAKPKIACVGDINRQKDQFKRSGGTVCFMNNEKVWQQYYNLVSDIEQCQKFRINKIKIKKLQSNKTNERLVMLG